MTTGRLSIELLEAFVAVAKTGNITRAGIELNRTQPCISTQIKRLEERVGKPLIERAARTMRLTQTGKILLENAEDILRSYEITRQRISVPELTGEIHVGLPEWYATDQLKTIFCDFSRVHPSVRLNMTIADSSTLHKMLDRNEVNLAIALVSDTKPLPENLVSEPLVWVSSQNHDICDPIPLVLFNEPCPFRNSIFGALSSVDKQWNERFTTTSVAAAQIAISSGLGISALPAGAVLSNFKILSEKDGFPNLDPTRLAVYTQVQEQSRTLDYLADHLSRFMMQSVLHNSTFSGSTVSSLRVI